MYKLELGPRLFRDDLRLSVESRCFVAKFAEARWSCSNVLDIHLGCSPSRGDGQQLAKQCKAREISVT